MTGLEGAAYTYGDGESSSFLRTTAALVEIQCPVVSLCRIDCKEGREGRERKHRPAHSDHSSLVKQSNAGENMSCSVLSVQSGGAQVMEVQKNILLRRTHGDLQQAPEILTLIQVAELSSVCEAKAEHLMLASEYSITALSCTSTSSEDAGGCGEAAVSAIESLVMCFGAISSHRNPQAGIVRDHSCDRW